MGHDPYPRPRHDPKVWFLLVSRIPSEPTRLRAGVWRRLKGLGAICLHNAVAALPGSAAGERALRTLRAEIEELGGIVAALGVPIDALRVAIGWLPLVLGLGWLRKATLSTAPVPQR